MPRGVKKEAKSQAPKPEYDKLDMAGIEDEIKKTKTTISEKNGYRLQVKGEKKNAVGAYNEQLKEIEEDLEHFDGVLRELKSRKRQLEAATNAPAEVQAVLVPVPPA